MQYALVAIGGAGGSLLRYGLQKWGNGTFPFGTFLVNMTGCFLIGLFWGLWQGESEGQKQVLLMTGFCGGFTTFSAFTLEGIQLLNNGRTAAFFIYTGCSIACGLLATFAGYKLVGL